MAIVREELEPGVNVADVMGRSRIGPVHRSRKAAAFRIKRELNWNYSRIGRFLGGRHHNTIMCYFGIKVR